MRNASLQNEGFLIVIKALKNNSSVTDIDLSGNIIGNENLNYFSELLKENSSLKTINLSSNIFTSPLLQSLSNSLQFNNSLTSLNLSTNKFENFDFLFDIFKLNSSLKEVYLRNTNLNPTGMKFLSQSLLFNSAIELLHLGNNILNECHEYLEEIIKTNNSIHTLHLNNCSLKLIDSLNVFSNVLCSNTSLTHLNIKYNKFNGETNNTIKKLFYESLKTNNTLKKLELFDFSKEELIDTLQTNNSLTELIVVFKREEYMIPYPHNSITINNPFYQNIDFQKINYLLSNNKLWDTSTIFDISFKKSIFLFFLILKFYKTKIPKYVCYIIFKYVKKKLFIQFIFQEKNEIKF